MKYSDLLNILTEKGAISDYNYVMSVISEGIPNNYTVNGSKYGVTIILPYNMRDVITKLDTLTTHFGLETVSENCISSLVPDKTRIQTFVLSVVFGVTGLEYLDLWIFIDRGYLSTHPEYLEDIIKFKNDNNVIGYIISPSHIECKLRTDSVVMELSNTVPADKVFSDIKMYNDFALLDELEALAITPYTVYLVSDSVVKVSFTTDMDAIQTFSINNGVMCDLTSANLAFEIFLNCSLSQVESLQYITDYKKMV